MLVLFAQGRSVQGVSVQGVSVLVGKCPGGKCPGGKFPGGNYVIGVSVQLGVHVRGGYVLEPDLRCALRPYGKETLGDPLPIIGLYNAQNPVILMVILFIGDRTDPPPSPAHVPPYL